MRHQFTVQSTLNMNNLADQRHLLHSQHKAISVVGLPAFDDNLIWLLQPTQTDQDSVSTVCVVDPGDAGPVIDYCRRHQLIPATLLLTHHHADHTGGVGDIQAWVNQFHPAYAVTVYGPEAESIPAVNHPLVGGEVISLWPGINAEVLAVAGHTRGHLAYFLSEGSGCQPPALFSGDLIFGLGCGRLFEGTAEQMYDALTRVSHLDPQTRIYCAHEYTALNLPFALKVDPDNGDLIKRAEQIRALRQAGESTLPLLLAEELATNPFMRSAAPTLAGAVCGEALATPCDIFAALRSMRDSFKSV